MIQLGTSHRRAGLARIRKSPRESFPAQTLIATDRAVQRGASRTSIARSSRNDTSALDLTRYEAIASGRSHNWQSSRSLNVENSARARSCDGCGAADLGVLGAISQKSAPTDSIRLVTRMEVVWWS